MPINIKKKASYTKFIYLTLLPMFGDTITGNSFQIASSRKKEGAPTFCDRIDGSGEHYAK